MRALFFMVFLTTLSFTLSACGQKGPLYLPEKPSEQPKQTQQELKSK